MDQTESTMVAFKDTIVIDDVIPPKLQDEIHDYLMAQPVWRFIEDMSYSSMRQPYPSHGFSCLIKHPEHGMQQQEIYDKVSVPIIEGLLNKIDIPEKIIYFNRAFLQVPLDGKFIKATNGIHVDLPQDHYACVYYVTGSDGDTIVYEQSTKDTQYGSTVEVVEHKRVTPKKGRMVLFDGSRFHCSSQPRNHYRCIVNFDLIKENV